MGYAGVPYETVLLTWEGPITAVSAKRPAFVTVIVAVETLTASVSPNARRCFGLSAGRFEAVTEALS